MIELLGAGLWVLVMVILGPLLGSGPEVPADPASRARHYVSNCLTVLKSELYQVQIVAIEGQRLVYRRGDAQWVLSVEGTRILRDGKLLTKMGDGGRLSFERISPNQIQIHIASETSPTARHSASLRLSVT